MGVAEVLDRVRIPRQSNQPLAEALVIESLLHAIPRGGVSPRRAGHREGRSVVLLCAAFGFRRNRRLRYRWSKRTADLRARRAVSAGRYG